MKKSVFFFAFYLLAISAFATETWTIKAPMPAARTAAAAVCIDSTIYVIGGGDTLGNSLNSMIAYNVYTNTWSTKASMSVVRNDFFAAVVNGKIYAIGGYNAASGALNVVEEYNPATNSWTTKAPMPTSRSLFSGAAIGNKIYCAGGWPATYAVNEEYDVTTNTWATKAPLPFGKLQLNGGAAMGGKFYLVGGKNYANTAFYDSCLVYSPVSNSWSYAPNAPVARFSPGTTYLNGRIYHMGGGQGYFAIPNFDNNVYYDSATNSWHTALACLSKRCYAVAVAAPNNKIYLIGGGDSTGTIVRWNHEYSNGLADTTIPSAVNNITNSNAGIASIFPNPCMHTFSINTTQCTGIVVAVNIINAVGQTTTMPYTFTTGNLNVDVSALSPGIYTVMTTTTSQKYLNTIVIK